MRTTVTLTVLDVCQKVVRDEQKVNNAVCRIDPMQFVRRTKQHSDKGLVKDPYVRDALRLGKVSV